MSFCVLSILLCDSRPLKSGQAASTISQESGFCLTWARIRGRDGGWGRRGQGGLQESSLHTGPGNTSIGSLMPSEVY